MRRLVIGIEFFLIYYFRTVSFSKWDTCFYCCLDMRKKQSYVAWRNESGGWGPRCVTLRIKFPSTMLTQHILWFTYFLTKYWHLNSEQLSCFLARRTDLHLINDEETLWYTLECFIVFVADKILNPNWKIWFRIQYKTDLGIRHCYLAV